MINEYFQELLDVPGVEIVALFDNQNRVMDSLWLSRFNPKIFHEIGRNFLQIFGMREKMNINVEEITIPFEHGVIYARSRPKYLVFVYGKSEANIPHLRMALNVCLSDFEESRKIKKMLKKLPEGKVINLHKGMMDDVENFIFESILENKDAFRSAD